jgi:hypothetical protein
MILGALQLQHARELPVSLTGLPVLITAFRETLMKLTLPSVL